MWNSKENIFLLIGKDIMKKTIHRKGCGGRRDGGREDTPATGKAQGTFRGQRRFSVVET